MSFHSLLFFIDWIENLRRLSSEIKFRCIQSKSLFKKIIDYYYFVYI